jgi:hypothetical protein
MHNVNYFYKEYLIPEHNDLYDDWLLAPPGLKVQPVGIL